MRRVVVVLVGSLILAGCGHVSSATALRQWSQQSNFSSAVTRLLGDAHHAASALRAGESSVALHTVCGVLLVDVQSANASLPTPDAQTTSLLSHAYESLGAGANRCYKSATSRERQRALAALSSGAAKLVEARARVSSF